MERSNQIPARAAEKRHRIIRERLCAGGAVHRKQQPGGLSDNVYDHWRRLIVDVGSQALRLAGNL
ncbi:MAG: hypothetical protein NTNFB01_29310 [Nitrospira sp.]